MTPNLPGSGNFLQDCEDDRLESLQGCCGHCGCQICQCEEEEDAERN